MAQIYENAKGYKIIEVSSYEMWNIGCGNICDHCGNPQNGTGFYVAVLNRWFCPQCFEKWYDRARNYATAGSPDKRVEDRNFDIYKKFLKIE